MSNAPAPTRAPEARSAPPKGASGPLGPARTSTTPRLARGDIPTSWSQPAESVSTVPTPVGRPSLPVLVVLAGTAACVVVAVGLRATPATVAPAAPTAPVAPVASVVAVVVAPAPPVAPPVAPPGAPPVAPPIERVVPIEDIPLPPPTSSTTPSDIAPEDQGGGAVSQAPDVVTELPARKKTKGLVLRAERLLLANDAKAAAPLLKRAAALNPSYADAWRNLGIARAQLGDISGARIAYKKYLTLAPTAPDAAEVRQILAE